MRDLFLLIKSIVEQLAMLNLIREDHDQLVVRGMLQRFLENGFVADFVVHDAFEVGICVFEPLHLR